MFVQLVDDDLGHRVALELNDDAHTLAVRFVANVSDALNLFFVYQLGDLLDQPFLIHHVGNFADDDLLFAGALDRLGEGLAAHLNDAFAFLVGLDNRLLAMDESRRWEIRARNVFHQLRDRHFRVFDERH